MGDLCNVCGESCSSVPWVHVDCLNHIVAERDALRAALEVAEVKNIGLEARAMRLELTIDRLRAVLKAAPMPWRLTDGWSRMNEYDDWHNGQRQAALAPSEPKG